MTAGDLVSTAVVIVLGVWLAGTGYLATPLGNRSQANPRLISRLIPRWSFFAPVPGMDDFHLLYRDELQGGVVGPWRECSEFAAERTLAAALWHPSKRAKKTLCDVAVGFTQLGGSEPDAIRLSIPHLLLLSYVTNLPRSSLSAARQFVIVETNAAEPRPQVVFLSGMHSLCPNECRH